MKDLTQGPVRQHLLQMSAAIAFGMLLQTLYLLVDLYFVSRLGRDAVAGVGSAGNATFVVVALTQILNAGSVALISQAVGRRDPDAASLAFNQSVLMASCVALATLAGGYALAGPYMDTLSADAATAAAGRSYLYWYLPGLALQFALVVLGSALRGTGIVKPAMIVQAFTVLLNAVLAPVLIAGWFTHHPLGVAGAGLASSIAIAAGVLLLTLYYVKLETYVHFQAVLLRPRWSIWRRLLNIGLPVGGEFILMFIVVAVMYWAIRGFGAQTQAGYGIGARVMQSIFLPAMAIAFAAAPIAGQNFGGRHYERVRATFRAAALLGGAVMLALTLLCQISPRLLVRTFSSDPAVLDVAADYLRVLSWNFVAVGLVFTCSSLFQGMGNTWPSFFSSSIRLFTSVLPVIWLAGRPATTLHQFWYVSVASVTLQALISLLLLRREMQRRLPASPAAAAQQPAAT